MDDELILAIKKEIEQVFGRRIVSSRDCNALSEEIFEKTGFKINANTLRRFFGLVKSSYAPSSGTLQILCSYCGFKSGEELKKIHEGDRGEEIILKEESILYYLVYPFKYIQVADQTDETFVSLVKGVIIFINRYPQLSPKFHSEIAKTKNGQNFYFEQFINYDKLNSFYGEGIRYYLAEKTTANAQIFGHSLLVFRYWLTKENDKLARHFKAVKHVKQDKYLTPFICGRYFACRLYHAHANESNTDKILAAARKSFHSVKESAGKSNLFGSFEYVFGEALVLTGHFEEALYYFQKISANGFENPTRQNASHVDVQFCQTLMLLQTLAFYESNFGKRAEKIYKQIRPSDFYFLSKKYMMILFLCISNYFTRNVTKTNDQLKTLISDTGFIRLNDMKSDF
jgi:hypothetical protein